MFITQLEHTLEAGWYQFNRHNVKELYVKARQIPKGGNSQQCTLAWELRYDTKDKKDQLLPGSHTELEQVITVDQANTLVQEVGDGLRYWAEFRGLPLVFLLDSVSTQLFRCLKIVPDF
jgi:hypothetical protein